MKIDLSFCRTSFVRPVNHVDLVNVIEIEVISILVVPHHVNEPVFAQLCRCDRPANDVNVFDRHANEANDFDDDNDLIKEAIRNETKRMK